jgi:predicted RNA-binding Zn-ribbon protein involved in translation (DUF1610 family)
MSERSCPRCHTPLTHEDSGVLFYCGHCGAPQVLLSQELREQAAEAAVAQIAGQTGVPGNFAEAGLTSLDTADPTAVDWSEAVRVAGLGGLIALGLGLISMAAPPVVLLELLWALIAPIVLLGIYCARRKQTRIRAGFGARLGLVSGLMIALCIFAVDALRLIFDRFVFHRGADVDAAMVSGFAKIQEAQAAQPGQPPLLFLNSAVPEFRVGLILFGFGISLCFYLAYAVIGGAFSGLLRSRSRTA